LTFRSNKIYNGSGKSEEEDIGTSKPGIRVKDGSCRRRSTERDGLQGRSEDAAKRIPGQMPEMHLPAVR
jgi:hypothetical protein